MSIIKPPMWAVSPGLVHPNWGWFWESAVGAWLMWEAAGSQLGDLSFYRNNATLTVSGTGGWDFRNSGPVLRFNGNDSVDTGVTGIGGISLFAASTQKWSVICRASCTSSVNGTMVAKCGATAGNRTFQFVFDPLNHIDQTPTLNIRGTVTFSGFRLDDGNLHTYVVNWDGSACTLYADDGQSLAIGVGTAAEETTQNIRFGVRTNATGFPFTGDIDFVHILNRPLSEAERSAIFIDPYGPFRMWDEAWISAAAAPAAGNYNFGSLGSLGVGW